jgi:flagellar basal body-associated protein FliL
MAVTPTGISNDESVKSLAKTRKIKILRKILLAFIVAIAVTSITWFIYIKFFMKKTPDAYIDTTTRQGVAEHIRANTQPTPVIVRYATAQHIRANTVTATTGTSKEAQAINKQLQIDRQSVLRRLSQNQ